MSLILKALIALVLGAVGFLIAKLVFTHFNADADHFWATIIGIIVGLAYFFDAQRHLTQP